MILALAQTADLRAMRNVGYAVSDWLQTGRRRVTPARRTSWRHDYAACVAEYSSPADLRRQRYSEPVDHRTRRRRLSAQEQ